jgi:hypothetical protein
LADDDGAADGADDVVPASSAVFFVAGFEPERLSVA